MNFKKLYTGIWKHIAIYNASGTKNGDGVSHIKLKSAEKMLGNDQCDCDHLLLTFNSLINTKLTRLAKNLKEQVEAKYFAVSD